MRFSFLTFLSFFLFISSLQAKPKLKSSKLSLQGKRIELKVKFKNFNDSDFREGLERGLIQKIMFKSTLYKDDEALQTIETIYKFYFDIWDDSYKFHFPGGKKELKSKSELLYEIGHYRVQFNTKIHKGDYEAEVNLHINPLTELEKKKVHSTLSRTYKGGGSSKSRGIFAAIIALFSSEEEEKAEFSFKSKTLKIP